MSANQFKDIYLCICVGYRPWTLDNRYLKYILVCRLRMDHHDKGRYNGMKLGPHKPCNTHLNIIDNNKYTYIHVCFGFRKHWSPCIPVPPKIIKKSLVKNTNNVKMSRLHWLISFNFAYNHHLHGDGLHGSRRSATGSGGMG